MPSFREPRALTAGRWLLAAVVPLSALAMGSILTQPLLVMTLLAAASSVLLWLHPPERTSRASRFVLLAMAVLCAATLLQVVPLPDGLVRALAPANADVWERALTPFREPPPAWHAISVAPAATRVELLRGLFYVCVFFAAVRVAGMESGTAFLERVVVASCAVMALTTLAHAALGAERVFGVYTPREHYAYLEGRYGPLLNTNHLAAYLDIGACVAVGVAVSRRPSMPRPLAMGAAVLLCGSAVWAASRGGTGALLFGLVLVGALVAYTRRRFASASVAAALVGFAILTAAILVGLSSSEFARADLSSHDLSKLTLAKNALALVPKSPLVGFGRGAFESVFPSVQSSTMSFAYTHPENIVAQWSTEWGVPFALAGAALFAWALRPTAMLSAPRPAIGAWAALAATVVHDLVDFHLEVPGVASLACVCAAIVVASRSTTLADSGRRRSGSRSSSGSASRLDARAHAIFARAPFLAAAAAALAALWVLPVATHMLQEDRADLSARLRAKDRVPSPDAYRADLRSAILRYPADSFLPLLGAVRAELARDESVVPWIARALERQPRFGRAHFVLARSLAARHAAQARLEYRLAYEYDETLRSTILTEAPRLVADTDDALELVPEGPPGITALDGLAKALGARLPSTAVRLDEELLRRDPAAPSALRRRVRALLADIANAEPWCTDRAACTREGLAAAQTLAAREPEDCEPQVLVARLQIAAGDVPKALDGLESAIERTTSRSACERQLVSLAIESGQRARADAALDRLVRRGCSSSQDCAELYAWVASTEASRGNLSRAVSFYRRASDAAPERDDLLENVATASERLGTYADAIDAYQKLARRHPGDAKWAGKAAAARERANERNAVLQAHPSVP
jgi:hypothetical protein